MGEDLGPRELIERTIGATRYAVFRRLAQQQGAAVASGFFAAITKCPLEPDVWREAARLELLQRQGPAAG